MFKVLALVYKTIEGEKEAQRELQVSIVCLNKWISFNEIEQGKQWISNFNYPLNQSIDDKHKTVATVETGVMPIFHMRLG